MRHSVFHTLFIVSYQDRKTGEVVHKKTLKYDIYAKTEEDALQAGANHALKYSFSVAHDRGNHYNKFVSYQMVLGYTTFTNAEQAKQCADFTA